jgi:nickel/cobalt exporter
MKSKGNSSAEKLHLKQHNIGLILSLAVGGVNPILLMVAYASSVAIALIGITVLAVKVYLHIQHKMIHYTKYLPKISALVLAAMAVGFASGFL